MVQATMQLLVGDVLLSAACIAYYGAFPGDYRQELVSGWVEKCREFAIPVSPDCTLRGILASPIQVPAALGGIRSNDMQDCANTCPLTVVFQRARTEAATLPGACVVLTVSAHNSAERSALQSMTECPGARLETVGLASR